MIVGSFFIERVKRYRDYIGVLNNINFKIKKDRLIKYIRENVIIDNK